MERNLLRFYRNNHIITKRKMKPNPIKHIFFDLDNTIWDFIKNSKITLSNLYDVIEIEEKHNVAFQEWYEKYYDLNEQLWAEYRDNKISKEELKESRFKNSFNSVGIDDQSILDLFEAEYLNNLPKHNFLCDGAKDLLHYLKTSNKYTLHIITNGFKDVSLKKIKNSGINDYFDVVVSAEDVKTRKPFPEIFDHALSLANAKKEESIIIGDDFIADIQGGLNYGIQAIYYNTSGDNINKDNFIEINHLKEVKKYL